jgi:SAM-dependent methyltransferase
MAKDARTAFVEIYERNLWKGTVSISGPGSSLGSTRLVRPALRALLRELGIRSLLDAPCGDAGWVAEVVADIDDYLGVDIVPALIHDNLARLPPNGKVRFEIRDIIADALPTKDAVLCRDCIVHLPLEAGLQALENIARSGCLYVIATTFPSVTLNRESDYGGWRPLNLCQAPFFLPPPLRLIAERDADPRDKYNDKSLGLWSRDQFTSAVAADG